MNRQILRRVRNLFDFKRIVQSKLVQQTGQYTVINILDRLTPFIVIPILARIISKEQMGYYTLYQAVFQLLIPILTLSVDHAILINYYKMEQTEFNRYFSTGIFLSLILYSCSISLGLIFSSFLSELIGLPLLWFQFTLAIVLLQFISQLRKNLWRVKRQPIAYGKYSIPLTISKNIFGLAIVVAFKMGWEGIIIGHFIAQLFFSLIALWTFKKEKTLSIVMNKNHVKDLLKFGWPLSLHRVSAWFSMTLNRVVVNSILGKAATGSFGIGATFGVILTIVGDAVNQAYVPYLYEKMKKGDQYNEKKIVKLNYALYLAYFGFSFVIYAGAYYGVAIIFGQKYLETRSFIFPVILASLFNNYYKLHVNIIFFTKKTLIIARTTIICAAINIPLAYFLVKYWALIGAAYSAVITNFIMYAITVYYSNRQYKLPWLYFFKTKENI